MPRRIYTYPTEVGWGSMSQLATSRRLHHCHRRHDVPHRTCSSSRKSGAVAGNNPVGCGQPGMGCQFPAGRLQLRISSRSWNRFPPMWVPREDRAFVTGLRNDRREVLVTTLMDAEPHHRYVLPGSSIWPFVDGNLTVSIGFVGSVFNPWYIISGSCSPSLRCLAGSGKSDRLSSKDEAVVGNDDRGQDNRRFPPAPL